MASNCAAALLKSRLVIYRGVGRVHIASIPSCARIKVVVLYLENATGVYVFSGVRVLTGGRLTIVLPNRLISVARLDPSFLYGVIILSHTLFSSALDKFDHFSPLFFICVEDRC